MIPAIGPVDYERNHAADQLTAILTDTAFDALVVMCRCPEVAEAVRALLVALAKARG